MADVTLANADADLSGKTVLTAENPYTITGLHTYSRGTNPPFAVAAGAAGVSNLDADKLNGHIGSFYQTSWTQLHLLNSDTGAINNWAPSGLSGNMTIEWSGASAVVTGLTAGFDGQRVTIRNTGTGLITFAHNSGASSTGNKFVNTATTGVTPVAPGGWATFVYDGTFWVLVSHEQGAWITPGFSAGDFTSTTGTWTVGSGDIGSIGYYLRGRNLTVHWTINTTTCATTPARLQIGNGQWGGFTTGAHDVIIPILHNDNGSGLSTAAYAEAAITVTVIQLVRTAGSWSNATDNTGVYGLITFEVG